MIKSPLMRFIILAIIIIFSFIGGWLLRSHFYNKTNSFGLTTKESTIKKPFEKYTIENLAKADIKPGKLEITEKLEENDNFTSYLFRFTFNPSLDGKLFKTTTGQINIPTSKQTPQKDKLPIVIMLRGYINQETFKTGDGTRNAAKVFAENGFITVAPDFLGYGESDKEADNILETRFQTYTTVLSLIKSLEQIPQDKTLIAGPSQLTNQLINKSSIFIWGHSNGGQIALTILEITGENYPTTLWAPVSKFFPYSVLYYTEDSIDGGKLIRRELAKFEEIYDVEKYSLTNYLDRITAPILVQQGEADDAVPISWSDKLIKKLKDLDKQVTYYTYPSTDHNMRPSWDQVVQEDLVFFRKDFE